MRVTLKLSVIVLLLVTSCGTQLRDGQVSEPDFAQSNNGTMLIVTRGSDFKDKRRYCVAQVSEDETAKLLTANGGLSRGQLKTTLRYMGYDYYLVSDAILGIGLAITYFGSSPLYFLGAIPVALAYRVWVGHVEGEDGKAKVIAALSGGPLYDFMIENTHRAVRARKLISSKKALKISDKKMMKVIKRISIMESDQPGTCNQKSGGAASLALPQ